MSVKAVQGRWPFPALLAQETPQDRTWWSARCGSRSSLPSSGPLYKSESVKQRQVHQDRVLARHPHPVGRIVYGSLDIVADAPLPFGKPVVPEVYIINAAPSGSTSRWRASKSISETASGPLQKRPPGSTPLYAAAPQGQSTRLQFRKPLRPQVIGVPPVHLRAQAPHHIQIVHRT